MPACSFSIPFTKDATEILDKAKKTVESQDGVFTGDIKSGNFNVTVFGNTITGTYEVDGQNLNMNIIDKPFMVPCAMIESYLKGQLS